jgi:hypothetical protein
LNDSISSNRFLRKSEKYLQDSQWLIFESTISFYSIFFLIINDTLPLSKLITHAVNKAILSKEIPSAQYFVNILQQTNPTHLSDFLQLKILHSEVESNSLWMLNQLPKPTEIEQSISFDYTKVTWSLSSFNEPVASIQKQFSDIFEKYKCDMNTSDEVIQILADTHFAFANLLNQLHQEAFNFFSDGRYQNFTTIIKQNENQLPKLNPQTKDFQKMKNENRDFHNQILLEINRFHLSLYDSIHHFLTTLSLTDRYDIESSFSFLRLSFRSQLFF